MDVKKNLEKMLICRKLSKNLIWKTCHVDWLMEDRSRKAVYIVSWVNVNVNVNLSIFTASSCNHVNVMNDLTSQWKSSHRIRLFRIMSIPTMFRLFLVLTSEQIGRRFPVFTLLLWQRQHIIVVDAVDYK